MPKRNDLERLRGLSGEVWNVAVDEYKDGYLTRRDLIRYAGLLGLTAFAASQNFGLSGSARAASGAPGGTIRVALDQPTAAIDPVRVTDPASIGVISQVGEYLLFDDSEKGLNPSLASSWGAPGWELRAIGDWLATGVPVPDRGELVNRGLVLARELGLPNVAARIADEAQIITP